MLAQTLSMKPVSVFVVFGRSIGNLTGNLQLFLLRKNGVCTVDTAVLGV